MVRKTPFCSIVLQSLQFFQIFSTHPPKITNVFYELSLGLFRGSFMITPFFNFSCATDAAKSTNFSYWVTKWRFSWYRQVKILVQNFFTRWSSPKIQLILYNLKPQLCPLQDWGALRNPVIEEYTHYGLIRNKSKFHVLYFPQNWRLFEYSYSLSIEYLTLVP